MNYFAFSKILLRYFKFLFHLEFPYFLNTCTIWPNSILFQYFKYRVGTLYNSQINIKAYSICYTFKPAKAFNLHPRRRADLWWSFRGTGDEASVRWCKGWRRGQIAEWWECLKYRKAWSGSCFAGHGSAPIWLVDPHGSPGEHITKTALEQWLLLQNS